MYLVLIHYDGWEPVLFGPVRLDLALVAAKAFVTQGKRVTIERRLEELAA